ncbi:MAG: SGNH/GDSL hydrolase family protein [Bacteroidales bacterium]|nr:SGNH/GDSL hydrolase family protein [Bacteroidales bacterium]
MKILCIGDSLSRPGHTNLYEDTWFYKLKEKYKNYDFISVFQRSLTTDGLITMGADVNNNKFPYGSDCLEYYNPQVVILQLGIVDCAPRLIKENSLVWKIVRRMPKKVVNKYIDYLKRNNKRDTENVYVSKEKFRSNLIAYFNRCQKNEVLKVIYIAIPIPGQEMIFKNPSIITNVIKYNDIISEVSQKYDFVKIVNPLNADKGEDIYDDGYHPNPRGNIIVLESLVSELEQIIK